MKFIISYKHYYESRRELCDVGRAIAINGRIMNQECCETIMLHQVKFGYSLMIAYIGQ